MFPRGIGNDGLAVDTIYIISIYGTDNVFTAVGEDLRVRTYNAADNTQQWRCVQDANNQLSFINVGTGKYMGRDIYENLACFATSQREWERLEVRSLPAGGYRLYAYIKPRSCPTVLARDSGGSYMKVVAQSNTVTRVGLHQVSEPPFRRFEWVSTENQWLARSSAPNYDDIDNPDPDRTQNMDDAAVQFLVDQGITNVISMNQYPLSAAEQDRLTSRGISYTHISVRDFRAPTLAQLDQAQQAYTSHISGRTLVYCGYGHGRTGTVISALQIYSGRNLTHEDYKANHVEDPTQFAVLDALKKDRGFRMRR